jgi:glutathione S-transferase
MMEAPGLPKGVMWESCAIMQYLSNKHHLDKFYPTEPEKRAMVNSAMFYIVGTIYPYLARPTYGELFRNSRRGRSERLAVLTESGQCARSPSRNISPRTPTSTVPHTG